MPTLDPQLAAEFSALEKLRLAVLQYRDEVIDLRKSRGLSGLADIPRVEFELPEEFQALVTAAKAVAPVFVVAPVAQVVLEPVVPIIVAPVTSPEVVLAPVAPPMIAIPAPVSPAAVAAQETSPATEPAEHTETFDERVRTSPFAPIASPSQLYLAPRIDAPAEPLARYEPGLAARAEVLAPRPPEVTEIKASAATPIAPRAEARGNEATRTPVPVFSPSIPNRRPGMSQSMQVETVGSFLRRFRLAND